MKQVVQNYRTGELKVADVPAPRPGPGNFLVATRVSLISSGTEKQLMDLARSSLVGKAMARPDLVRRVVRNIQREGLRPTVEKVFAKLDTPIPLGYSVAGEVIELGRGVTGAAVGDRVACAGAGLANHAEFNAVPKNLVVPIPRSVDDEDASFVTLGAIALQGVRQAGPLLGERIVVMGLGLIGLITVQILKANGCRVLGFDPNPLRVGLARQLGADTAIDADLHDAVDSFTDHDGADAVVITASSASSDPINNAAEISRLKGRIVVVGMVGMKIDREPFYKRELELKLSMSYGPGRNDPSYELEGHDYPLPYVRWTEQRNMQAFLGLVADGKVTPKPLVTHRFAIADAEQAYGLMQSGESHLAILLNYPGGAERPVERRIARSAPRRSKGDCGIAFIGLGNYAKGVLLPAFRKVGGVNFTTVVTATGISAGHASEKYGFTTIATDPVAAVNDPSTDAVVIATRHDTHAELTSLALRAGKHVFCEKPLAIDAEGLAQVLEAASEAPGLLTVGFNRRFSPLLTKAKAAVQPRTGPLVMLYRVNAGVVAADSWIKHAEGGGRILGEVCHFIDALNFITDSVPVTVQAVAARNHDDALSILLRFADGSIGTIVYSSLGDINAGKEYIELFANNCVVQLDDFHRLTITKNGRGSVRKNPQDKGQQALVGAFVAAVKGNAMPPMSLDDIASATAVTFAVEEALRVGEPVTVSDNSGDNPEKPDE